MLTGWPRRLRPFWYAYRLWLRADCGDLSAAFAYHTLQSFFPALLIALAIASRMLGGDGALRMRILEWMGRIVPPEALFIFESTLLRFLRQGFGAGLLGVVLLVISASNIFLTLQRGADRLWWNRPFGFDGLPWQQVVLRFFALRLKAFVLLLLIGLLFTLDQLIGSLRFLGSSALRVWLQGVLPAPWVALSSLSTGMDVLLSLLVGFGVALAFLWLLPSRRIPLRPLLPGALLLSAAITLLNQFLAPSLLVLGIRFQAYGVVGGVLLLTLWIWGVGGILYYAQCLSVVVARHRPGGHSPPLYTGPTRHHGPG